jgi:L-ascorbate metabolism protein UlaG (beta-lactamase superfamily)
MSVAERIRRQSVASGSVAIWWLGQNSYVVKCSDCCVMIDPFFSRPGPREKYLLEEAPLRADELEPEAVLCTHDHSDHTDPPFLRELAGSSPNSRFFGPPESVARMVAAGVPGDRASALENAQTFRVGRASVGVVLSKTSSVSDVAHYGYVIESEGLTVYNTGDIMRGVTDEPSLMQPLQEAAPHVALITTSPTEEEFPDFAEAAQLASAIRARVAVPSHYHCFAKRTFDPAPFVDEFPSSSTTRPVVIPYCGCYLFSLSGPGEIVPADT